MVEWYVADITGPYTSLNLRPRSFPISIPYPNLYLHHSPSFSLHHRPSPYFSLFSILPPSPLHNPYLSPLHNPSPIPFLIPSPSLHLIPLLTPSSSRSLLPPLNPLSIAPSLTPQSPSLPLHSPLPIPIRPPPSPFVSHPLDRPDR